jgi:hypothetical protein
VLACFLTRLVVAWKQVVFVLPSLIAMCDASFFFHLFFVTQFRVFRYYSNTLYFQIIRRFYVFLDTLLLLCI